MSLPYRKRAYYVCTYLGELCIERELTGEINPPPCKDKEYYCVVREEHKKNRRKQ